MKVETLKRQAAEFALQFVKSGMVIGLGSGSTALFATQGIGRRFQAGDLQGISAIPTSRATEAEARALGIPLTTLEAHPQIDLTIDGADEVDPDFNLIKGGGGALLREKIVAQATRRQVIVVDDSKLSDQLGTRWAVPVEVIPFGWASQATFLQSLGARHTLRRQNDGSPYMTDQGNLILDCNFGKIEDAGKLAEAIKRRAGIVEHGLFIQLTDDVIVASQTGVRHLSRSSSLRD